MLLTHSQICTLNECLNEFQAFNHDARKNIVEEFLDSFRDAHNLSLEFDRVVVATVRHHWQYCAILTIFLGYLAAYI